MDMAAGACVLTSSVALCFPGGGAEKEGGKKAPLLSNPLFLLFSAWKPAFEIRSCASNFDQCGEEEKGEKKKRKKKKKKKKVFISLLSLSFSFSFSPFTTASYEFVYVREFEYFSLFPNKRWIIRNKRSFNKNERAILESGVVSTSHEFNPREGK